MSRSVIAVTFAAFFVATATAQQNIPTGGPIPDRRGLNNTFDGPRVTSQVEEVVRRVAGNVYVIAGSGGNIEAQAGSDGILLVDDNFTIFYPKILAAIRQLSDKPVRIIVNTHSHPDHNQNNANFAKQGALIFAHPNTRLALMQQRGPSPVPAEGLPQMTSSERITFHFNGEDVTYLSLKPSHTNGDVAVYFHGSDVFAFGDVFTTDYPAIGVEQGGTIENFIDNYNLALQMTTPNTIFVPGHGQLSRARRCHCRSRRNHYDSRPLSRNGQKRHDSRTDYAGASVKGIRCPLCDRELRPQRPAEQHPLVPADVRGSKGPPGAA